MTATAADLPPGPDGRAGIDAALVHRLLRAQAPHLADLPVRPVPVDGWDNRTYRLGDDLAVRLPTAQGYAAAVGKEHRWLPVLAPRLPLAVPEVLLRGEPAEGYPHPWSVRRWIAGEPMGPGPVEDVRLATDLAAFLRVLHGLVPADGPAAGEHSFFRGSPPEHYDAETRSAVRDLGHLVDARHCLAVWDAALEARFEGRPCWFHGDVARGNLLLRDGRLVAVIDFGTSGVGDPACDLVITWTSFTGPARGAFREAMGADEGAWARARGWALWKALITLVPQVRAGERPDADVLRVVRDVLAEAPTRSVD